jgi:hypothetical protein
VSGPSKSIDAGTWKIEGCFTSPELFDAADIGH